MERGTKRGPSVGRRRTAPHRHNHPHQNGLWKRQIPPRPGAGYSAIREAQPPGPWGAGVGVGRRLSRELGRGKTSGLIFRTGVPQQHPNTWRRAGSQESKETLIRKGSQPRGSGGGLVRLMLLGPRQWGGASPWRGASLSCWRPWVQFPSMQKRKEMKMNKIKQIGLER